MSAHHELMRTTFIIAQKIGVSPFDIMEQDIELVIMVINFLVESAYESKSEATHDNSLSEKDRDKDFWSAL